MYSRFLDFNVGFGLLLLLTLWFWNVNSDERRVEEMKRLAEYEKFFGAGAGVTAVQTAVALRGKGKDDIVDIDVGDVAGPRGATAGVLGTSGEQTLGESSRQLGESSHRDGSMAQTSNEFRSSLAMRGRGESDLSRGKDLLVDAASVRSDDEALGAVASKQLVGAGVRLERQVSAVSVREQPSLHAADGRLSHNDPLASNPNLLRPSTSAQGGRGAPAVGSFAMVDRGGDKDSLKPPAGGNVRLARGSGQQRDALIPKASLRRADSKEKTTTPAVATGDAIAARVRAAQEAVQRVKQQQQQQQQQQQEKKAKEIAARPIAFGKIETDKDKDRDKDTPPNEDSTAKPPPAPNSQGRGGSKGSAAALPSRTGGAGGSLFSSLSRSASATGRSPQKADTTQPARARVRRRGDRPTIQVVRPPRAHPLQQARQRPPLPAVHRQVQATRKGSGKDNEGSESFVK